MWVGDHAVVGDASLYFVLVELVELVAQVLQVAQVEGYDSEDLGKRGGY